MKRFVRPALFGLLMLCGVFAVVYAAKPTTTENIEALGNSYHLYTQALQVDESGVVPVPPRFRWSVETSWRGVDALGKNLPDTRVMLRLHDPDHNFTAITAQMDLTTASKLHKELGDILARKLQDPDYQFRPQLYRADQIPTKRIVGVDGNGTAIVEDVVEAK